MRTIRELAGTAENVYILLRNKPIRFRFMADAAMEGITYKDGTPATDREADDIMALQPDGTICYVGWVGRLFYRIGEGNILRVDYKKYIDGEENYIIQPKP